MANLSFEALRSATRCITREHVDRTLDTFAVDNTYPVFFHRPGSLLAATGGASGLFFDVVVTFEVLGTADRQRRHERRIAARTHECRILDYHRTELLAYHWQPEPRFAGPDHPHPHASAVFVARLDAISRLRIELDKLQLITGQVSLQAVIRMLIAELKIAPRRPNWREMLDRTEALAAADTRA